MRKKTVRANTSDLARAQTLAAQAEILANKQQKEAPFISIRAFEGENGVICFGSFVKPRYARRDQALMVVRAIWPDRPLTEEQWHMLAAKLPYCAYKAQYGDAPVNLHELLTAKVPSNWQQTRV